MSQQKGKKNEGGYIIITHWKGWDPSTDSAEPLNGPNIKANANLFLSYLRQQQDKKLLEAAKKFGKLTTFTVLHLLFVNFTNSLTSFYFLQTGFILN